MLTTQDANAVNRIHRASKRGSGCHLSPEEVRGISAVTLAALIAEIDRQKQAAREARADAAELSAHAASDPSLTVVQQGIKQSP